MRAAREEIGNQPLVGAAREEIGNQPLVRVAREEISVIVNN